MDGRGYQATTFFMRLFHVSSINDQSINHPVLRASGRKFMFMEDFLLFGDSDTCGALVWNSLSVVGCCYNSIYITQVGTIWSR